MNRFQSISVKLTAALLSAAALVTPTLAATGTVDAIQGLRLRSEASTESAVLAKLSNGTKVDVTEILDSGWVKVLYKDHEGYLSQEFVVINEEEEEPEQESETPPPETAEEPQAVGEQLYGRVNAGPLNVRSQPTAESTRLRQLLSGSIVEIRETLEGWYSLGDGYVCADYITLIDAEEAKAALETSGKGGELVAYAKGFLGCRYVYGGTSPKGFDCSGFVKYVYSHFGVSLNRTASAQMSNGVSVSRGELQPGDLVFFNKGSASRASHVGIYIGNGQLIHASTSRTGVIISNMGSSYYTKYYVGARRIF